MENSALLKMMYYLSWIAWLITRKAIWLASGFGVRRTGLRFVFLGCFFFAIRRVCHKGCPLARVWSGQTVPVPRKPLVCNRTRELLF